MFLSEQISLLLITQCRYSADTLLIVFRFFSRYYCIRVQSAYVVFRCILVSVLFLLSISFPQLAAFYQQFIKEMCYVLCYVMSAFCFNYAACVYIKRLVS